MRAAILGIAATLLWSCSTTLPSTAGERRRPQQTRSGYHFEVLEARNTTSQTSAHCLRVDSTHQLPQLAVIEATAIRAGSFADVDAFSADLDEVCRELGGTHYSVWTIERAGDGSIRFLRGGIFRAIEHLGRRPPVIDEEPLAGERVITIVGFESDSFELGGELLQRGIQVKTAKERFAAQSRYVLDISGCCPTSYGRNYCAPLNIEGFDLQSGRRVFSSTLAHGVDCPSSFYRQVADDLSRRWVGNLCSPQCPAGLVCGADGGCSR